MTVSVFGRYGNLPYHYLGRYGNLPYHYIPAGSIQSLRSPPAAPTVLFTAREVGFGNP